MNLMKMTLNISGSGEAEKTEVTVLAAASLTDALGEIIAEYEKDADVTSTLIQEQIYC